MARHSTSWPTGRARLFGIDSHSRNSNRSWPSSSSHGQAQLMLGRYLAEGAAGEFDPTQARSWFEQAVAQGIEEAQADLAAMPAATVQ